MVSTLGMVLGLLASCKGDSAGASISSGTTDTSTGSSTASASDSSAGSTSSTSSVDYCEGVTLPDGREPDDVSVVIIVIGTGQEHIPLEYLWASQGPNTCGHTADADCAPSGVGWEASVPVRLEPGSYCHDWFSQWCWEGDPESCDGAGFDCGVGEVSLEIYEVTETCVAGHIEFIPGEWGLGDEIEGGYFLAPRCDPLPLADPEGVEPGPCTPDDTGTSTDTTGTTSTTSPGTSTGTTTTDGTATTSSTTP